MSITETLSESLQVPVKSPTGKRRFGMLPEDVLSRRDISPSAKLILQTLNMESYSSGMVGISHSIIAGKCGVSRPTVIESLAVLERLGLIAKEGPPSKQVQRYRLKHADMLGVRGSNIDQEQPTIDARPRAFITCSMCIRPKKQMSPAGICYGCIGLMGMRDQYQAAMVELGQGASHAEICKHIHATGLQRKWMKVQRMARERKNLALDGLKETA